MRGARIAKAVKRLDDALAQTRVAGVATNRDFLLRLLRHPAFVAGEIDTGFLMRHHDALLPPAQPAPEDVLLAASRALIADEARAAKRPGDPYSPWSMRDGWRLDGRATREVHWRDRDTERVLSPSPHGAEREGEFTVSRHGNVFTVIDGAATWRLILVDPLAPRGDPTLAVGGGLTAPMPGKIVQVLTAPGESVKRGQPLLILEAMKMEHTIAAPADGTVEELMFAPGDQVAEGNELLRISA